MPSTFFSAFTPAAAPVDEGFQLYQLGADQSVTQWTAIGDVGAPGGFNPLDLTEFNGAVWFEGFTGLFTVGQLYKLGSTAA